MESYINYLLSDIVAACRQQPADPVGPEPGVSGPESIEDHFADIERWLESDPEFTFSYYCGLEKEIFPPAEQLTDQQMESVCAAFEKLLQSWNMDAEIPEQLPQSVKYKLLVSVLDEKVDIPNDGLITIEFCTYDPPSCPFDSCCSCRGFCDTLDDSEKIDKDDIPF